MVMSWKMGVVACGFGLMINWRVKEALGSFDLQFGVMICLMQIDKRIQNALHTHSQSRGQPTFEEEIRTELTLMSSGYEELDRNPDNSSIGDDQGIDEVPELIERPIADNDDDDDDDDFEFKVEGINCVLPIVTEKDNDS